METIPERLEPVPESVEVGSLDAGAPARAGAETPILGGTRARAWPRRRVSTATRQEVLWIGVVYLGTRVLLLLAAYLEGSFGHHPFLNELSNWDGFWYRELANHGYPDYASHTQTTLGFFPLYPVTIWVLEPFVAVVTGIGQILSSSVAGVVISAAGGFVASVLVYRLAIGWWGKESARRATILFCVFPGSVVFSMAYSEGILLPLAVGCLYALERRRWLLAGILAGLATAVGPTALMLIPACAVAAALELRRRGWSTATARRVLVAPLLSLGGVAAFALFLWAWTGTPLANYDAQHFGWSEKTDPLAMVNLVTRLAGQVSFSHFNEPTVNANLVVGLIGAVVLLGALVLMLRPRRTIPAPAIVWTLGITFLTLTSEYVPPNPRMLLTAFPALMVVGHYVTGKWFRLLVWSNGLLLVGLSLMTFTGTTLRP